MYHSVSVFRVLCSLKAAGVLNGIVNNFFCPEALDMVKDYTNLYSELMVKSVALRKFSCKGKAFGIAATILFNYLLQVQ